MARPTRKEAEDFHHYIIYEQGDWEAAEYSAELRGTRKGTWMKDQEHLKARLISGAGYPIIGSYDDVVETFQKLEAVGLNGAAMGMINYVNDFPHIQELLPRMERVGLRKKPNS
jgi:alkanesulfonate monooxygenase SsuD/methylene tetrahydromethanopterin reductase-like flavin-dependent oxidoreductase (luciferase family)